MKGIFWPKSPPSPSNSIWFAERSFANGSAQDQMTGAALGAEAAKNKPPRWSTELGCLEEERDRAREEVRRLRAQLARDAEWERAARDLMGEVARLRAQLAARGREGTDLDQDRINDLLRLVHPDKHDNSELSNEVTKWLLAQRKA